MNLYIEKYILISGFFLALLEVKVLGKVLILMFAWSVQIISGLDSQSKLQTFTLFSARHVGVHGDTPTWRLRTGLCKFVQNISTNIRSLGKRTDLKLGEMSYLFTSYNNIISWRYTLNGFRIIFFIPCQCKPRIVLSAISAIAHLGALAPTTSFSSPKARESDTIPFYPVGWWTVLLKNSRQSHLSKRESV